MNLGLVMLTIFPLAMAATEPTTDMKQVLDALNAQDSKPIETLTAEQARLQKGPSDAVKSVIDTGLSAQNACLYALGAHIVVALIAAWVGACRPQWD